MAIVESEKVASKQAETSAAATSELFSGDPNAESPFVIPSREIGQPFPQGVGGDRVDRYIETRFQRLRENDVEHSGAQPTTAGPVGPQPKSVPAERDTPSSRWQVLISKLR